MEGEGIEAPEQGPKVERQGYDDMFKYGMTLEHDQYLLRQNPNAQCTTTLR